MKARQKNMLWFELRSKVIKPSYALQKPGEFHLNTEAK